MFGKPKDSLGGGDWFESRVTHTTVQDLANLFGMEVHAFVQEANHTMESRNEAAHFTTLGRDKSILDYKKLLTKYPFLRDCITTFQGLVIDTVDL